MSTDPRTEQGQVFGEYAHFYDAMYKDKDYEAECDFVEEAFRRFSAHEVSSVLDLGCGTGNHVLPLVRRGYEVVGVDRAPEMVRQAREKAEAAGINAEFLLGDVRTVDLGRTFDAVIEMFAVIGYQTTNEDLLSAMRTARKHLTPGGVFVFDAWFGPAVLVERPEKRSSTIDLEGGETLERYATPQHDLLSHTYEVRYGLVRRQGDDVLEESHETHHMRYLFPQEIVHFLDLAGFETVSMTPFMDFEGQLTEHTWNVSVVAKAR